MFKHLYKHTFVFTWSIAIFTNSIFVQGNKYKFRFRKNKYTILSKHKKNVHKTEKSIYINIYSYLHDRKQCLQNCIFVSGKKIIINPRTPPPPPKKKHKKKNTHTI